MKNFFSLIKNKISFFFWNSKKPFFTIVFIFMSFVFLFSLFYMFIAYNNSGSVFKKRKNGDVFIKKSINVNFKGDGEFIISKTGDIDLDFSKIYFVDKYYSLEWLIVLPGDYFDLFDKKLFLLDNDFVEFISVENFDDDALNAEKLKSIGVKNIDNKNSNNKNSDIKTVLRVKEKDIFAFDTSNKGDYLMFDLKNPKDVYNRIIVVDPAHGGMDFGVNNGAVLEKDMTLKICMKIEELSLKDNKFKIYLTRNSDDYIKDEERFFFANQYADFFISVHISALDRYNFSDKSEIYYQNNKDSDCYLSPKKCSEIFKSSMMKYFSFADFKISEEDKTIFDNINSTALLFEIGYNSNDCNDNFFQNTAMGIYDGINKIFE